MVSVLIVNWNTRDLLRLCLASLTQSPCSSGQEVIVVDNASTDGSAEMVRAEFPEAMLLAERRNHGYARGNNLAFEKARGAHLLTLNPDTEVYPGAIDAAVAALEASPRRGCVAACLIGKDGAVQRSVRGFPTLLGIAGDLTGLADRFPKSVWASYRLPAFDYSLGQPAPQPMGTFLLFKREALAEIGAAAAPFDEQFPIFFNEVDLLLRLARAGWETWYEPAARVLHHGGASTRQVRKSMIWESHRSLLRFLRKHHLVASWAYPLVGLAVWTGALVRARGYHAGFRP